MPPLRINRSIHVPSTFANNLSNMAGLHGGRFPRQHARHQPYTRHMSASNVAFPQDFLELPSRLLANITYTQEVAISKTTQKKDMSHLREFLAFCKGLRIQPKDALPAKEEVLLAWASSYAGHLAGKIVSTKLLAIKEGT
jgi:hypothetical protein